MIQNVVYALFAMGASFGFTHMMGIPFLPDLKIIGIAFLFSAAVGGGVWVFRGFESCPA